MRIAEGRKLCTRHLEVLDKKHFDAHPVTGTHAWCRVCREDFRAICNPKYRKKLFMSDEQKRLRVNRLRREKYKERKLGAEK
ncbi:MAG: hypothetical protein ACXWQO_19685 [Bdellovibrionota bacterium]